jgi:hypothetical protein
MIVPHLCRMTRFKRNARQLFMLKAFFDEAGDNDIGDFLMGGWLARFDEWEKFTEAWDKELY